MVAEKVIQREILRYLHARGIMAWKAGTGAFRATYKETDRFVRFGLKGQPDIFAILPPEGRMIGIEVKTELGRLSAYQHAFMVLMRNAGALAFVARSVKDVHDTLERVHAEQLTARLTKETPDGPSEPPPRFAAPVAGYHAGAGHVPPFVR